MAETLKINPVLERLVAIVVAACFVYLVTRSVFDGQTYSITPKATLISELTSLQPLPESERIGEVKFTDRQTFYYVTQEYSSASSASDVARYYREAFEKGGWRFRSGNVGGSDELEFCKKGIQGSISFLGGSDPVLYTIQLTTGGTAIRTRG